MTGWALAREMARPGAPLDRLGDLFEGGLAQVMAHRADVPLDRLGELYGYDLAWVMAHRADVPLDRIGELCGTDLALVMVHRPDAPLNRLGELFEGDLALVMARRADARLDRLGELYGADLAWVLARRADAGGIQHPDIGGYEVWQWADTLTIGCATHLIEYWREHVEGIAARHNETKCVPAIRDLLNCISSADGGAS